MGHVGTKYIKYDSLRTVFPTRLHTLIDRIPELHDRCDLPGLRRVAESLQRVKRSPAALVPLYEIICSAAFTIGDQACLTEFALRMMAFGQGENLDAASAFVEQIALASSQLSVPDRQNIARHFNQFLIEPKNFAKLQDLREESLASWVMALDIFFRKQYLPEQLALLDVLFKKAGKLETKTGAAGSYAGLAYKVFAIARKQVDVAKVRAMTEYIFANEPGRIKDPAIFTEEYFDDFVVSLGCFGLFDLVEQAMALRKPESHLAVNLYVQLLRAMQQGPRAAYRADQALAQQIATASKTAVLERAFGLLSTIITRNYMETMKQSHQVFELGLQPQNYFDRALLSPVSDCPELTGEIVRLRRSVLAFFGKMAAEAKYFGFASATRELLGQPFFRANVVQAPGSNNLEVYIFNKDESACVKAHFAPKYNVKGDICGIEPQLFLEGVKTRDRQNVKLFWEYITLALLVKSYLYEESSDGAVDENDLDLLAGEINEFADLLALKENFSAFKAIEEGFVQEEKYREKEVELANCYRLARMIFETFVKQVKPATYVLSEEDFLSDIFASVVFVDPEQPETADYFDENKAKFPFLVILKDKAGADIMVQVKSADEIIVLGQNSASIAVLLQKYVLELVFRASAKLFTDIPRTETGSGQAAVIFGDGGGVEAGPEQVLRLISQTGLLKMAQQQGLHILPWCYAEPAGREDVLFYPFDDQSLPNKRKLLAETNPAEIFAQVDFFGSIRVLPVSRRVKRNGGYEFRPKNRTLVREQQKELLADSAPFRTFYQLFIKTTFSNANKEESVQIITPRAMREDENEILSDALLGKLDREVKSGVHAADPLKLLKGTSGERRKALEARIQSGELTISDQEIEVFEINTTYHRPPMVKLSDLLAQGYVLEK